MNLTPSKKETEEERKMKERGEERRERLVGNLRLVLTSSFKRNSKGH